MTRTISEPVSFYTHFGGFVISAAGFAAIILISVADPYKKAALVVYAVSVMTLFLASSLYHAFKSEENGDSLLRKFDHTAIYLMIAGTYTPFIYQYLAGWWRWGILLVQWSIVLVGALITLAWINKPRKLSAALYLAMGWIALVPMYKLWQAMPGGALALIFAGGAAYTAGAVIYALKRPDPLPGVFGFHEVFHLFILAGAGFFYWAVLRYLSA
ncbi:MAG: hemolysin III family protein [Spirochaetes bacterium]|nr:hemolysin III family protein [Spirochaetota bacterium]